jgi:hypothetical protein
MGSINAKAIASGVNGLWVGWIFINRIPNTVIRRMQQTDDAASADASKKHRNYRKVAKATAGNPGKASFRAAFYLD